MFTLDVVGEYQNQPILSEKLQWKPIGSQEETFRGKEPPRPDRVVPVMCLCPTTGFPRWFSDSVLVGVIGRANCLKLNRPPVCIALVKEPRVDYFFDLF